MDEHPVGRKGVVEKTIELARMLLSFGLVKRATHHEDQATKETDTTHTVMLGVMACAFAEEFAPRLDRGKIAQFALVHDLVEVYAGDTIMLGKLEDADKVVREEKAKVRIEEEFNSVYPWIGKTIEEYEKLTTPEARYVKVFDKVLPKLVHLLNKGVTVKELGQTLEEMNDFHIKQFAKLKGTYGADQAEVMELLGEINVAARLAIFNS